MTSQRGPLESGFMKSRHFSWPQRELVKRKCVDCPTMIETPANGWQTKRCKPCDEKYHKRSNDRYQAKKKAAREKAKLTSTKEGLTKSKR